MTLVDLMQHAELAMLEGCDVTLPADVVRDLAAVARRSLTRPPSCRYCSGQGEPVVCADCIRDSRWNLVP